MCATKIALLLSVQLLSTNMSLIQLTDIVNSILIVMYDRCTSH